MTVAAPEVGGWKRFLVEPKRPESIAKRSYAPWLAVGTVCIGAFMGQLDASIVNMALPTLQRSFHASVSDVTWVGLSYLLVLVSMVTAVGRLADMVGRKLLYTYGFVIFIIGSAACGFAPSLAWLDAFRVLQAVGAAMLQANSVAIIVNALPSNKLGTGIGIQGAFQALGLSLGPSVGGLLIQYFGWRWIFFVNVPAGILGTTLGWFLIPRTKALADRVRFDWAGLGTFVPAIAVLLLAITGLSPSTGWPQALVVGLFAGATVLLVSFIVLERRTSAPMLDLDLFKRVPFSAGIASGLLSYLVMFGVMFVGPFFLTSARHIAPGLAGTELMIMPLGLGLLTTPAGRLADKFGARPLTVGGMALTATMLVVMAFFNTSTPVLLAELFLVGAGLGAFTPPNNAAIMGAAPAGQSGAASGILNMTRGLGTAMGLSLTSLVFVLSNGDAVGRPDLVAKAFMAACIFLAATALVAMVLAAMRGNTQLNSDPLLSAE